jgi:hypothetical protein
MGIEPYYEHGGITIYHGDCRDILPGLGKFDLLLTDPPYGLDLDPEVNDRAKRVGGGSRVVRSVSHMAVAGDDRAFDPEHLLSLAMGQILWGANNYADKLPASPMWLTWDRVSSGDITDCELAWVGGHRFKTVRLFRHQWSGLIRASEKAHRVLHPTQKPVALMSWCLGLFPEAKTVIDPYMGSGPVAKACKDRGLKYVGIELVEKYCEIAAKRLAQEVLFA